MQISNLSKQQQAQLIKVGAGVAVVATGIALAAIAIWQRDAIKTKLFGVSAPTKNEEAKHLLKVAQWLDDEAKTKNGHHGKRLANKAAACRHIAKYVEKNKVQPITAKEYKDIDIPTHLTIKKSTDDVRFTEDFYDYTQGHVYVDFANQFVGGGVFGPQGSAQEERMMYEFPELLMACARHPSRQDWKNKNGVKSAYETRDGIAWQSAVAKPQPVVFQNVQHIFNNTSEYGHKTTSFHPDALEKVKKPTTVTVVAGAMPDLIKRKHGQGFTSAQDQGDWEKADYQAYVQDAFNTIYAAMYAAKKDVADGKKIHFHSGKWGCGAFGGDPIVVGLLHIIAAHHIRDIKLTLHGYSDRESEAVHALLTKYYENFEDGGLDCFSGQVSSDLNGRDWLAGTFVRQDDGKLQSNYL